jgi:hypothetical protein
MKLGNYLVLTPDPDRGYPEKGSEGFSFHLLFQEKFIEDRAVKEGKDYPVGFSVVWKQGARKKIFGRRRA